MDALSFLDERIHPILIRIDETLDSVNSSSVIEGKDLTTLVGLLHLLADADRMKNYGQAVINNRSLPDATGVDPIPDETPDSNLPLADVVTIDANKRDEGDMKDELMETQSTGTGRKVVNSTVDADNGWF